MKSTIPDKESVLENGHKKSDENVGGIYSSKANPGTTFFTTFTFRLSY